MCAEWKCAGEAGPLLRRLLERLCCGSEGLAVLRLYRVKMKIGGTDLVALVFCPEYSVYRILF